MFLHSFVTNTDIQDLIKFIAHRSCTTGSKYNAFKVLWIIYLQSHNEK